MIRYDHCTDKFVKVSDRECPWCKAVCAFTDKYCHECGWYIAKPQLVKESTEVVKDLVDDEFNPYDEECMRCKHLKLKCEFIPTYCKFESRDEPQTEETEMERLERIDNDLEDAWARIRELTTADTPQTDLLAKTPHKSRVSHEKEDAPRTVPLYPMTEGEE